MSLQKVRPCSHCYSPISGKAYKKGDDYVCATCFYEDVPSIYAASCGGGYALPLYRVADDDEFFARAIKICER